MTEQIPDIHVHVHVGGDADLNAKIDQLGAQMSALTDAIDAMQTRVAEDFTELRRLLDEAIATDAADAARIAELQARADQLVADNQALMTDQAEAITRLGGVDPDPNFPAAPTPEPTPEP